MNWFYNLKIKSKLLLVFAIIAVVMVVVGYVGIRNITSINESYTHSYAVSTVAIVNLAELLEAYQRKRVNLRDIIIEGNVKIAEYENEIRSLDGRIDEVLLNLEKSIGTDELRVEYDKVKTALQNHKPVQDLVINLVKENKKDEALALLYVDAYNVSKDIDEGIEKLVILKTDQAQMLTVNNLNQAVNARNITLMLLFFGLLSSMGLGLFVTRIITSPLAEFVSVANKVSSGDLTAEVRMDSRDEIGQLSKAFGYMIEQMRDVVKLIVEKSKTVAESSQQLTSNAQETSACANETAATMGEISVTVEQVTLNVMKISEASGITAGYADEGNRGIASITQQMQNIAGSSHEVASSIYQLNKKVQEISKIVQLITSIADQTNLLALNAAIEAARAGDQGRGFAVVAEEVRKLAEQSSNATKDIGNLINTIQMESQKAVENMAGGDKEVEAGTRVVREVGESFKQIISAVQDLTLQIKEVVSAAEQVSSGVQNVAASAEEQTAAMEEVSSSSEALSRIAEELSDLAGRFKV